MRKIVVIKNADGALASSEDLFYDPFNVIVCAYFNYMDVETSFLQEVMCDVCSEKML